MFGRTVTKKVGIITLVIGALIVVASIAMLIASVVLSTDFDYDDYGVIIVLNIIGGIGLTVGGMLLLLHLKKVFIYLLFLY